MCGICGYLGPSLAEWRGNTFVNSLKHRGPDGQGHFVTDLGGCRSIFLGHTRLAIIDLSDAASQPMRDPATGNRIVFNGEIYNYRSLRDRLRSDGLYFQTESDTEALLKGWGLIGRRILPELRGMYAFAIWEPATQTLHLAVDHAGIKPLYYWRGPGGAFAFASEARALFRGNDIPKKIDPLGLESFLAMGAVQAPHTMFEGVRSLGPGQHLAVHSNGAMSGPGAWRKTPFCADGEREVRLDVEEIRGLLAEAVRSHLTADVPVGLFLSGGIDSSVLAGFLGRCAQDVQSFSVTFPGWDRSEGKLARVVGERNGLRHAEIPLTEDDLLADLPAALAAMDQPSFDGLNAYVISKSVREAGLKVVLSGMGGDEVFGGYSTFWQIPALARWLRLAGYIANLETWNPADLYFRRKGLFGPAVRHRLFPDGPGWRGPVESAAECSGLDDVNAVAWLEMKHYLGNMLLRDTDCMGMAHGLEVRVPMLDWPLVDYMANVPGRFKAGRFAHKPLLVRAARDLLPPEVYRRPKQGFVFPWDRWLRRKIKPMAEAALMDAETFAALGMKPAAVRDVWKDYLNGRLRWNHAWALVALREWATRNLAIPSAHAMRHAPRTTPGQAIQ